MAGYLRRILVLPPEIARLEDELVAELWRAGTAGAERVTGDGGEVVVTAYFAAGEGPPPPLPSETRWVALGLRAGEASPVPDRDWLAAYRARARPFALGRHFWVDPREPEEAADAPAPPPGRSLLLLPARQAFGVGSHESTRLALALLEELDLAGTAVLDVGTGTGILAFAALRRGAARAVGLDLDPVAVFHARDNARSNALAPRLFAGTLAALAPPPGAAFHLVVANFLPEILLPELPRLAAQLVAGGGLVLSGILRERGAEVEGAAADRGLYREAVLEEGEWVAYRFRRPAA